MAEQAQTDKQEQHQSPTPGLQTHNHHHGDVGVNSAAEGIGGAQFQERVGISHQHSQGQTQNPLQLITCPTTLSELSPTSVTQSISPAPSPNLPEQRPPLQKVDDLCLLQEDKQLSSDFKYTAPVLSVKTSTSDGYSWRKYGQKQVKSPPGSRSYYRCTFSECSVKKIQSCDISGQVIEIVYKSQHTHDPPRKGNCTGETAYSADSAGNNAVTYPSTVMKGSDLSTTSKNSEQENTVLERKRPNSSDSDGNGDVIMNEVHIHEPKAKKRLKKCDSECSDPLLKYVKKPRIVVHAEGDVGISSDGYRWRKYGQKMVKGNTHPRNYYRCTSAGCPVRKHIESALDNTKGVIITYKGVHDHDMPVPKKRKNPPSAPLLAAAAPGSMNSLQIEQTDKGEQQSSIQLSADKGSDQAPTQQSVDKGGELAGEKLEVGGEKAMESARTLLSIGFEIKPC